MHVCLCVYIYVYMSLCCHACMYACVFLCMLAFVYVCIHSGVYVCVCVYVFVYMHVCMGMQICKSGNNCSVGSCLLLCFKTVTPLCVCHPCWPWSIRGLSCFPSHFKTPENTSVHSIACFMWSLGIYTQVLMGSKQLSQPGSSEVLLKGLLLITWTQT